MQEEFCDISMFQYNVPFSNYSCDKKAVVVWKGKNGRGEEKDIFLCPYHYEKMKDLIGEDVHKERFRRLK